MNHPTLSSTFVWLSVSVCGVGRRFFIDVSE